MLVWTVPEDSASRGVWLIGGGGVKTLLFCLGTTYSMSSMEDIENSWSLRWQWKHATKIIISVFKAWALAPLQINASLCVGSVYLFSCWVILLLYKHQLESTSVIFMLWFWLILSMTMTGSSLLWITMFSQPLIFESALHLCFAVSERASEIPPIHIASCLFWLKCWYLKLIIICSLADYAIDISLPWDLCVTCLCG